MQKKTLKEKVKIAKNICHEESEQLYMQNDIDFCYDHYDKEVETVYVRETEKSNNAVTHDLLNNLLIKIKTEVSKRWNIGILHEEDLLFEQYEIVEDDLKDFNF